MLRSFLVVAIVIGAGMVGVGHADATLAAEVDVVGGKCVDERVTQLVVDVDVERDEAVIGVIRAWSQRDRVRVAWVRQQLHPGEQQLTIHAPGGVASLRDDSRAQVMLNVGQRRAFDHFETGRICTSRNNVRT
ncbi:hypothetical protein [Haloarcula argentinensis]|uniref:Uncharacterized protein n=1 Tax=Haloarcula argentinensis TaxID=43776 RepID=A0A830FI50_HALAR|nr:hypothetical protein [Haloarcula argentinensis]GGM52542.1 hypothetical protein GCM10009006_37110 [Haloarcula argentinensis]